MAQKLSGGCACGAIHYECSADPVVMLNCHCRDCQQASGTAYAAIVVVPKSAVQIRGEPRYHKVVGQVGKAIERGFCPNCGSQVRIHRSIDPRWTSSPLARSRGIIWIPPSKSTRAVRRFKETPVPAT
jgi:hypothetical protein